MENLENVDWQVVEVLDVISVYDQDVALEGMDDDGIEYTAGGARSCGEIVDVYDIEIKK